MSWAKSRSEFACRLGSAFEWILAKHCPVAVLYVMKAEAKFAFDSLLQLTKNLNKIL
jgi:hypothetical protein